MRIQSCSAIALPSVTSLLEASWSSDPPAEPITPIVIFMIAISFSFDDELAPEHTHLAGEFILARFLRQELHRDGLARRQLCALAEVVEDHHFRAGRCFLA